MQEVRSMLRARKNGVLTPVIYSVEHEAATIFMERIEGASVRDMLSSGSMSSAGTPLADLAHHECPTALILPSSNNSV